MSLTAGRVGPAGRGQHSAQQGAEHLLKWHGRWMCKWSRPTAQLSSDSTGGAQCRLPAAQVCNLSITGVFGTTGQQVLGLCGVPQLSAPALTSSARDAVDQWGEGMPPHHNSYCCRAQFLHHPAMGSSDAGHLLVGHGHPSSRCTRNLSWAQTHTPAAPRGPSSPSSQSPGPTRHTARVTSLSGNRKSSRRAAPCLPNPLSPPCQPRLRQGRPPLQHGTLCRVANTSTCCCCWMRGWQHSHQHQLCRPQELAVVAWVMLLAGSAPCSSRG